MSHCLGRLFTQGIGCHSASNRKPCLHPIALCHLGDTRPVGTKHARSSVAKVSRITHGAHTRVERIIETGSSNVVERAAGIVDAIKAAIGPGACVPAEDGAVWIYMDTPFAQHMPYAGDPNYRRIYLRLKMQALTE